MEIVYIAFGSNIGNREENIKNAIKYLRMTRGIKIEKISSIIETEPVGGPPQPKYLNGVIKARTNISARKLLKLLQEIENKLKRVRTVKNGARTIDLDILLYGRYFIDEPDLKIPHPRMLEREFVMRPLLEIEPNIKEELRNLKIN